MTGRKLFFILSGFLLFGSCQKSVDWTAPILSTDSTGTGGGGNAGGSTNGDLLIKSVAVTGSETITTLYTYDGAKRLVTEDIKGTSGGIVVDMFTRYYRDASGRIYKVSQLSKMPGIPTDTAFMNVYYPNTTSTNYTYSTTDVMVSGFGSHDSTVYTWNTAGNLTEQNSFMSASFMPGVIISTQKTEYTYANGNLTQHKVYAELNQAGQQSLVATYNYTYDNNTNPINTGRDFAITGRLEGVSKNNVTKMEIIDVTTPSNSRTLLTTLSYGTGNKPTAGTVTMQPQNTVTKFTFFYQ